MDSPSIERKFLAEYRRAKAEYEEKLLALDQCKHELKRLEEDLGLLRGILNFGSKVLAAADGKHLEPRQRARAEHSLPTRVLKFLTERRGEEFHVGGVADGMGDAATEKVLRNYRSALADLYNSREIERTRRGFYRVPPTESPGHVQKIDSQHLEVPDVPCDIGNVGPPLEIDEYDIGDLGPPLEVDKS